MAVLNGDLLMNRQGVVPIILPKMGEGVHEATIVKWLKVKGDSVESNEPLLEVATDKVDSEIVAPKSGFFTGPAVDHGESVEVGQVLGYICDGSAGGDSESFVASSRIGESLEESRYAQRGVVNAHRGARRELNGSMTDFRELAPKLRSPKGANEARKGVAVAQDHEPFESDQPIVKWAGRIRSSPLARAMAKELGLDLKLIQGSGLYGRITKRDVNSYINSHVGTTLPESSAPTEKLLGFAGDQRKGAEDRLAIEVRPDGEYQGGVKVERRPMNHTRRLIASHVTKSVSVSPHVTTTVEIDVTKVSELKSRIDRLREHQGPLTEIEIPKVTFTTFFVHAARDALCLYPEINGSIDGWDLLVKKSINIGCAIATKNGLVIPVLKDLKNNSLFDIARKLNGLVRKAREKKLVLDQLRQGTFSITNPGVFGSLHSQPIINQPELAIMSVGQVVKRVRVIENEMVIRQVCQVGLTFDHRAIDGEGGANFLNSVKTTLEHGLTMNDLN